MVPDVILLRCPGLLALLREQRQMQIRRKWANFFWFMTSNLKITTACLYYRICHKENNQMISYLWFWLKSFQLHQNLHALPFWILYLFRKLFLSVFAWEVSRSHLPRPPVLFYSQNRRHHRWISTFPSSWLGWILGWIGIELLELPEVTANISF